MTTNAGPIRADLLTATFDAARPIERTQLTRIELAPGQAPGAHHHQCDVVGLVLSGSIRFRLDGGDETLLRPGDAFFEPRNAYVLAFDNASADEVAVFVACYLLESGSTELITMSPPPGWT